MGLEIPNLYRDEMGACKGIALRMTTLIARALTIMIRLTGVMAPATL